MTNPPVFPFVTLELDPFVSLTQELSMRKTIIATIALFAAAGIVRAADKTYPDITHEELVKAVAARSVTLLDANGTETYKEGHIPTAIDFEQAKKSLGSLLPADKNALIVAYCANEQCSAYRQCRQGRVGAGLHQREALRQGDHGLEGLRRQGGRRRRPSR